MTSHPKELPKELATTAKVKGSYRVEIQYHFGDWNVCCHKDQMMSKVSLTRALKCLLCGVTEKRNIFGPVCLRLVRESDGAEIVRYVRK